MIQQNINKICEGCRDDTIYFIKTFDQYLQFNFDHLFRSPVKLLEDLNMKFRSKFNHGFTIHGYLHCAILKPLHGCNVTRAHVAIDFSISLSKCQK